VVAMAYSVYTVAAAEFMTVFYERLFAGDTVNAAVAAGEGDCSHTVSGPARKVRSHFPTGSYQCIIRRQRGVPQMVTHQSAILLSCLPRSARCARAAGWTARCGV